MPTIVTQGATLYYQFEHAPGLPVLVLSNSLGTDLSLWEPQLDRLRTAFSLLRYDTRGHGRSSIPAAPCSLEQLGTDVLTVLDHLAIDRAHICGISLGGLTAQWLAINAPDRVDRLVLSNTAARIGSVEGWNQRIDSVQRSGMASLAPGILDRWFTPGFQTAHPETVASIGQLLQETSPEGYAAACAALRDADLRDQVHGIASPTLVLYGEHDLATTAADAELLAAEIPDADVIGLDAAHLANVEAAEAWTDAVLAFLTDRDEAARYRRGMKVRRAVLGSAHVDRSLRHITDFNQPFQDFITRYAWGEIWSRPGLPRSTRSLITLALMIALNREEEFKMHVRAAVNNGVRREEMQEVLLHCGIYCGLPAANNAFAWAAQVFQDMDQADSAGKSKEIA